MVYDSRCANASLVGRSVRRLATSAMAVALQQTIAIAATTGDMEMLPSAATSTGETASARRVDGCGHMQTTAPPGLEVATVLQNT